MPNPRHHLSPVTFHDGAAIRAKHPPHAARNPHGRWPTIEIRQPTGRDFPQPTMRAEKSLFSPQRRRGAEAQRISKPFESPALLGAVKIKPFVIANRRCRGHHRPDFCHLYANAGDRLSDVRIQEAGRIYSVRCLRVAKRVRRASRNASRRFVFTRSPGLRGIDLP